MNYSAENWNKPEHDRCIMSKGHSVPTQYVILAMLGIIPDDELKTIKKIGTRLQGHPDIRKTPGIEAPTGSLGQGLSFANGMALAGRMDETDFKMYVVLGDGELQEGQVWEAAMTTAHYGLTNICMIIDRNGYQSQGKVDAMMRIDPVERKWESFGWECVRINGHDLKALCGVLDMMDRNRDRPLAIVADTVKGKGISFIEDTFKYHNYAMGKTEYDKARKELNI